MSQQSNYVICRCQYCDKGIEFDTAELTEENSVVPCPHCGLETKLFIPHSAESEKKETPTVSEKESVSLQIDEPNRMKSVSINSELELVDDTIIIRRRGVANALAAGLTGERMISISTLTAMQLKLGVWWSPGFILFSYAGSKPFMGGIIEATQDPDAFIFEKEQNDEVSVFKAKVEKILRESKKANANSNSPAALTDEIRKLAELRQQGVLSQEEFDAAKRKLLA